MPNISLIWDFDGTLTPNDSTSLVVEYLDGAHSDTFWNHIKTLRGDRNKPDWEHVLASDAPIWTYALSRIAFSKKVPLNKEFLSSFSTSIKLYDNVVLFLQTIKNLENDEEFKRIDLKIHHFIITAGLNDLVSQVFSSDLVTRTWGCQYQVIIDSSDPDQEEIPESVPIYCIDETSKTRAIFEISKGTFRQPQSHSVNKFVPDSELFCRFEDMIYIGDGFTDVPSLSLVRSRGGLGVLVTNPQLTTSEKLQKIGPLKKDKRADFITNADFSLDSDLYNFIYSRCIQIQRKYNAFKVW